MLYTGVAAQAAPVFLPKRRALNRAGFFASPDRSMAESKHHRPLHYLAVLTAAATLILICIGGLVTSRGAGLAVPDWPTSYGYNMFFFPISQWVGGIREEHTHRLMGSLVGLLTTLLALGLHGRPARRVLRGAGGVSLLGGGLLLLSGRGKVGDAAVLLTVGFAFGALSFRWPAMDPAPRWLRRLGLLAFVAVVLQGVLGGLRVTLLSDALGVAHATFGQVFFCLTATLAFLLSPFWRNRPQVYRRPDPARLRPWFLVLVCLVLAQLVLGATMRHQRAGLAIPDFPLAYGSWWPATDPASLESYNQRRVEVAAARPIQAFHIYLHLSHRLLALVVAGGIATGFWQCWRRLGWEHGLSRLNAVWVGAVCVQFTLGAATVWTDKSADIATAHVAVGALTFMLGVVTAIYAWATLAPAPTLASAGAAMRGASGKGRLT